MKDLLTIFQENSKNLIFKYDHYFEVYERHFNKYRNKEAVILEIGVSEGGSLQMWKNYFGEHVRIYGIDINPDCKKFEEDRIEVFIGSQSDKKFLNDVKRKIPKIDIIIDDGGHTMKQQIVSFQELFDHLKEDGIYLCEDTHTSYWLNYGGGHKRNGTFIEYSKNFIDYLHAFTSEQKSLPISEFTRSVQSIHYYDSIIVIEKRKRDKPKAVTSGNIQLPNSFHNEVLVQNNKKLIRKNDILRLINRVLRSFRIKGFMLR